MEPLVSVIIPVFNRAKILKRTLKSVVDQEYTNIEIIVVDDASTDDPLEVIRVFGDNRIKYIRHPDNINGAAARNSGAREAVGNYVAFLDSDDEWLPNHLSRKIRILQESGKEGIYGSIFKFDGIKKIRYQTEECIDKNLFLTFILRGGYKAQTSTLIFKKEAFLNTLFDESLFQHQDLDLHARFIKNYSYAVDFEPTVIININSNDRMGRNLKHESIIRFLDTYSSEISSGMYYEHNIRLAIQTLYLEGRNNNFYAYLKNADRDNITFLSRLLKVPLAGESFVLFYKLIKKIWG